MKTTLETGEEQTTLETSEEQTALKTSEGLTTLKTSVVSALNSEKTAFDQFLEDKLKNRKVVESSLTMDIDVLRLIYIFTRFECSFLFTRFECSLGDNVKTWSLS